LPFNAIRPKIFLGDVGSYSIGFWLSATALLLWDSGASPVVLLGPFLLYLMDTSTVLFRRWRRGDSLFEAHREHAYQRLHQSGWSHVAVSALCGLLTISTSVLMLLTIDRGWAAQLLSLVVAISIIAGYLRFVGVRAAQPLVRA